MGNCCGGSATVPSVPAPMEMQAPAPQAAQRTTPAPVQSRRSLDSLPVGSPQLSRTHSRTLYRPEPSHHGGISSQDPNPRIRTKSAPQRPQSSKSSSSQNPRTKAETLSAPKMSSRSDSRPTNPERSKSGRSVGSRTSLIKASIENGRRKYWRNLWSSGEFTNEPLISLKDCVKLIHDDIVAIWNQDDNRCPTISTAQRNQYLSSDRFKIYMSHVVKDLAVPTGGASARPDWNAFGDQFADWVYDIYGGTQENVRCVMGYIVNLIVILNEMFRSAAGNVTEDAALMVMENHVRSGRRGSIHEDIRSFVTETFPSRFANPQKDLVLEKIIDLIRQYRSPPSGNS